MIMCPHQLNQLLRLTLLEVGECSSKGPEVQITVRDDNYSNAGCYHVRGLAYSPY